MSTEADIKATVGDIPNDNNLNVTQEESCKKGFCSMRHGLALILHLCNFSIYTQKMNLSIAITAMVNTTVASSQLNVSTERSTPNSQDFWNETFQESKAPVYDWAPEIQGILLSSLDYGSFLAPIPAGYVAGVFGANRYWSSLAHCPVSNLQSGILSALPFVVGCICIILGGLLADFLLSRKVLRLVTIRKLFTAVGVLVSSGILVPLPWVRTSRSTTMAFLVLSSASASLCDSGALINFLDIAPR